MSEQAATSISTPPKKRSRRIIRILGIAALLLAVLFMAAPWIVTHTGLRDSTINTILDSPSVTASTESASVGWFSPMSIRGLDLTSTNKRILVYVDDIATEGTPLQLFTSSPNLGAIRVDKPHVQLELPLNIDFKGRGNQLEPTFMAIVKNGILTVRLAGEDTPAIDVDEVTMTLRVEKTDDGRVLTADPVVIFDKRKVTPKLARSLLHLFDPTMNDIPQVSGEITLSLDKVRIPLGVPRENAVAHMELEGKLVLHNLSTQPKNPMRKALVQLVADMNGKQAPDVVRLTQDAEIRFWVREGRLHHEGLRIGFPDIDPALQVTSRGSVGLDKTLDLHLELPRLDKALRKSKAPAKCRVTGTIDRPKIAIEDASLVLRQLDRQEPIIAVDDVNVIMRVENPASGPVLAVEPVAVFKKAKLSGVAAKGLMSLIAPDVDSERQVNGEISLEFDTIRIPLGVQKDQMIKGVEAKGKLTLHHITAEVKKPMWQAIVKLLADMHGKQTTNMVRLADGAEIQFHLRDGRLHHDGLRVGFPEIDPDLVISSRGSIGTDETLDIHLEVPRLRKEVRDKGPVKCHVTGTLAHPKVAISNAAVVVFLAEADKATFTLDNVNLNVSVETIKDVRVLTMAPMTLFDKKKLTPEVGDQLLHLIAPTLAELSGVEGEISLSFDTFRVPLGVSKHEAVKKVELAGKLHLHQINVSTKTPLVQTMVKVLADMYGKQPSDVVRVVEDAEVRFQVREGRMYHEGLRLGFPDISPDLVATSQGYVGYDSSLDIVLEVPRIVVNKKDRTVTKGSGPVRFRITGTIEKPIVKVIEDKEKAKIPSAVGLSIILPLAAQAQEPPVQQDEIRAVVRISKLLIDDVVARREIVASVPYQERVMAFRFQGLIDGWAKLSADMTTNEGDGIVVLHGQGTAETYARGVLGPVVAMGPAWGSFTTETVVRFDGRKFSLGNTIPWSEVHGEVERVEGRRGGLVGRAAGRLIRPIAKAMVPRAERQATPIANRLLVDYVNELGGKIVDRLNERTPVEKSLNRVLPESRDWEFQLSTDSQFVQAAYGPPNATAPVLPENPGRPKDTRLELWLRTTNKEAQALAKLTKQPLAKQLVQRYLESTLPELAALSDERTVTAVGPWLVICIGAPKED